MVKVIVESVGVDPCGLAWDGTNIWLLDEREKTLIQLDTVQPSIIQSNPLQLEMPRGLTFNGSGFWIADNQWNTLNQVDPNGKITRSIDAPTIPGESPRSIEGITWSKESLWIAYSAGWSSQLFQVTPETGTVKNSMFSGCDPRGLASDGKRLWTICYNGPRLPAMIDERLTGKPLDMVQTRKFIHKIPEIKQPSAITYNGRDLLVADKQTGNIYSLEVKKIG
jgi:hypothetical protein